MTARARVVVTTYERPRHLRLALAAWRRQTWRDFALTVADDGSGPETAAIVRAFAASAPFRVDHVRQEHDGYRRAAILNEAVRRGAGEPLLVFTDGDCVPPADFLRRHVRAHADRSFAVAGAYMLGEEASRDLTEADVEAGRHEALRTWRTRLGLVWRAWKSRIGVWRRKRGRPKVAGLNVAVDRAAFEAVNGYDEAFVGYGLEDRDLGDRLMALRPRVRLRILYGRNDTIHVWHPSVPSAGLRVNRAYYDSPRPVRCARGLVRDEGPGAAQAPPRP